MTNTKQRYLKPYSVDEAICFAINSKDDFTYLAGGTDVMPLKFEGNNNKKHLIDLYHISELKNVKIEKDHISIGAAVTLSELIRCKDIISNFPILYEAASVIASAVIRSSATIGGNILCENRCKFYNQSEWWRNAIGYCLKCDGEICIASGGPKKCYAVFVSDLTPALICLDAQLEYLDREGSYTIYLEDMYTGDGLIPCNLPSEAIITKINIPFNRNYKTFFRKLRPRNSIDFTNLTVAMCIRGNGKLKISLSGMASKPLTFSFDKLPDPYMLIKNISKKCPIVENLYYSRLYRKEMLNVYLKEGFEELDIK
ncbi:MAG: hypothetical protein FVQ77_16170 [Cytophagales bacterium]|nr:hypothetical protein [Cytophagales bacterium]